MTKAQFQFAVNLREDLTDLWTCIVCVAVATTAAAATGGILCHMLLPVLKLVPALLEPYLHAAPVLLLPVNEDMA